MPEVMPFMEQQIDRREVTIGDRIHLTLRVFTEEAEKVVPPENVPMLSNFVVKQRYQSEKLRSNMCITTFTYELVHYDVGWDTIPPITIMVLGAGDTTRMVTQAEVVEIQSVAPGMTPEEDIRALRPQIGMRMPVWQYVTILLMFGSIVAIVLFLVWKRRRSRLPAGDISMPPWEVALEALHRLAQREPNSPEEVKQFYTELSRILRIYYEERFLFPAVEHTTTEIMRELKNIAVLRPFVKKTGNFLTKSDLVKFAKYIPKSVDSNSEIGMVKEIVECTTEKKEEEKKDD